MRAFQDSYSTAYPYFIPNTNLFVGIHFLDTPLVTIDGMCVTIHYQTIPGKLYVTPHNDAFVTYKLRVGTYSKVIAKIHPCSMLNEYLRSQSDVCSVLKYQFSASFHRQASGIVTYQASAYKSLGIICKTESQAREMADKLQIPDINFLSSQSSAFVQGIVIISAHMAKGLEFDEVIIPQVDDRNYHSEIDRSMLYVAVTRAMHRLTLTYSGTKHTPFI